MGTATVGQLEMKIRDVVGDPKGNEVHVYLGRKYAREKLTPLAVVVHDPSKYDRRMFRTDNRVVLSQPEMGTPQLREVYCGKKCVYSAAKD